MKCIVCLTDNNLNTHMKVEIDGETYEVHLCDEHAETTTMAQVNKKVKEIKDKLKHAVQLAIDLGISIPEINTSPIGTMPDLDIVPQPTPAAAVPVVVPTATQTLAPEPAAQLIENKIKREEVSVKLSDNEEIGCDTEIEMQEVELRGGKVNIPKSTKGEAGTSSINIINTRDDTIQKRFKNMKESSDMGQPTAGYSQDCLACQGTGIHPVLKKECPKCGGAGVRA